MQLLPQDSTTNQILNTTERESPMTMANITYIAAKQKFDAWLQDVPLQLQTIERATLEVEARAMSRVRGHKKDSVEQSCVNYLRHRASDYDCIIHKLDTSVEGIDGHILYLERRSAMAAIKKRILDEIAAAYPWLTEECIRQKARDGVEDDASEFILPFGPFRGHKLKDIHSDYLLSLLGQGFVRKSFRTRIERHLADRIRRAG
jgi:hypothetical protein